MEDDRAPVAGEWLSSPVDRKLGREMLSAIPPGAWRAAQELAAGAIRSWGSDARGMPASYGGAADGMLTSEQTQYLISHEAFRAHVMHRATEGLHNDFTNLAYATRLAVEEPSRRQQVREQLIDLVWHEYGHSDLDQRYLHGYFEHAIEDRQLTGERAFFASESDLIVGLIDLDAQPSEPERFDGVTDAEWYLFKSMPSYARAPLLCTDLAIIYACAEYESDYEFEEDDTRPLVNEAGWRVDRPGVDPTPVPDEAVSASKLALLGYSAPPVPGGTLKLSRATQYNTEPDRNSDIDVSK